MPKYKVLLTDYAWSELEIERQILAAADAELLVADNTDEDRLVELASGVDAILTCWAATTARVIGAAQDCRLVSRMGIGLDNIDVDYCTQHGIPVTNVPDYCGTEVAEHTIALVLALARRVAYFHHETKSGRYDLAAAGPIRRLAGQTLGIVGLGSIGRRVAERARALGMNVLATTRSPGATPDVTCVPLPELLASSDFVSLHLPLTEDTRGMIGGEQLALMRPTAYLINTSRGGLVDHRALAASLAAGELAGAALDVQDPEPPDLSQPPFDDPRVIVTPHAAFVSVESVAELRRRATENIATVLRGDVPADIVNGVPPRPARRASE